MGLKVVGLENMNEFAIVVAGPHAQQGFIMANDVHAAVVVKSYSMDD